jgi:hypothetical protein
MTFLKNTTLLFSLGDNNYRIEIDKLPEINSDLDYWTAFKDVQGNTFDINIWYHENFFKHPIRFSILHNYKVKKCDDLYIS